MRAPWGEVVGRRVGQRSRTAMPGSSLPSRYSRLAPPPVEMWPNAASSKPSLRTAAAESPPPTTVRPVDLGQRLGDGAGAVGERVDLEDAHRAVPEHRPARRRARPRTPRPTRARCRGPRLSAGISDAGDDPRLGLAVARRELGVDHDVGRQHDLDAGLARPARGSRGRPVELVLLEQALADLVALGREEGEHHAAADQQLVGLGQQVVDHAELVGDLRAAEHDDVRALRVDRSAAGVRRSRWPPAAPWRAAAAGAMS